ncbi:hypothetical protein BASA50_005561 [Batrachochytrium salamandrivorans]|uniref:Aflatoxin regulatory protein domain-containing protein n=1 Tax=Batrachochytrium salamandrivorans TaxID=1357716 RepID=A0ABQ8FCX8_9FUNG|nr:hypothetical protein BASA60_006974 [Batrachochytrium salamandrivorans]KAH6577483.1 hypothetical protein BASA62_000860 [Batrachochytrium salamandrivorans]KAH6581577.1 hypothetical protein BASA61_008996 [Batrachochytrium salamandrivorans]KAH6595834.1 hypothetical protein BASA50_005561 [Batrachochytrium salamandrivorans]KAH9270808.1 hypothetical protein BASA83_006959 [Batrachochytrium salamandrivorans]
MAANLTTNEIPEDSRFPTSSSFEPRNPPPSTSPYGLNSVSFDSFSNTTPFYAFPDTFSMLKLSSSSTKAGQSYDTTTDEVYGNSAYSNPMSELNEPISTLLSTPEASPSPVDGFECAIAELLTSPPQSRKQILTHHFRMVTDLLRAT